MYAFPRLCSTVATQLVVPHTIFFISSLRAALENFTYAHRPSIDVAWPHLLSHKAEHDSAGWLKARLADPERLQGRHVTTLIK